MMKQMFSWETGGGRGNAAIQAATQATGAATVQLPSEAVRKEHTMKLTHSYTCNGYC